MTQHILKGYSNFAYNLLKGLVSDFSDPDTIIKAALFKQSYVPDQDNDKFFSDISSHEITGDPVLDPNGDYPEGGFLLGCLPAGASVSIINRVTTVDFNDGTVENSTIGAWSVVIYDATKPDPDDQVLIAYSTFAKEMASNSGTYKIILNDGGLFSITVSA